MNAIWIMDSFIMRFVAITRFRVCFFNQQNKSTKLQNCCLMFVLWWTSVTYSVEMFSLFKYVILTISNELCTLCGFIMGEVVKNYCENYLISSENNTLMQFVHIRLDVYFTSTHRSWHMGLRVKPWSRRFALRCSKH